MNMSNALVLSLVVLLPLIPAYVLYRFLSSEANVEGPLHGLKFVRTDGLRLRRARP